MVTVAHIVPRFFLLDVIVISLLFRIFFSWLRLAANCNINIRSSIKCKIAKFINNKIIQSNRLQFFKIFPDIEIAYYLCKEN